MGCAPSKSKVVIVQSQSGRGAPINGRIPNERAPSRNERPPSRAESVPTLVQKESEPKNKPNSAPSKRPSHHGTPIFAADKTPLPAPPRAVAFDVTLDQNGNKIQLDKTKLPSHIKTKLAPLENAPRLTADMLAERQNLVEQNRLKELEKKKEVSRQSSRLRNRILAAKEFDQHQYKDKESKVIDDKQMSAGKNREAKIAAQEEKKRLREERARRVKARAEQLKKESINADLGFEIEKDDASDDDNDSWLGDDDPNPRELHTDMAERLFTASASGRGTSGTQRITSGEPQRVTSGTERVYSGRESPAKRFNQRSSAELKARMSASTTDSHDYAFQRTPAGSATRKPVQQAAHDDFFDS